MVPAYPMKKSKDINTVSSKLIDSFQAFHDDLETQDMDVVHPNF